MAKANVARHQGDAFQARLFWLYAACLLDPHSNIVRVAYETGPKSFDDILIEYDPKVPMRDQEGHPLYRRYIQCKGHTSAGVFGYADLIDPEFINASRFSLLQRVYQAQKNHAPDGLGCRFELKTNWRIRPDDPLIELIGKSSDAINVDRLFEGKTENSCMGQVRRSWREHLKIDDAALRLVARVLAVSESPESLMTLRERLDERFAAVGLKRVPASESAFVYDDLVKKLLGQGRMEFDRDSFRQMARGEGLLADRAATWNGLTIGVRSFMHPIDDLENRCDRVLDLVSYFEGRYICDPADWQTLYCKLHDFVLDAARMGDLLRVIVDTHVSLAFAVGALLNVKSGKRIEIEQRGLGRRFWSMDDETVDSTWPKPVFELEQLADVGEEVAVAVSLTHNVSHDVRAFVARNLSQTGCILHCRLDGGHSHQAVRCGSHAWKIAEELAQQLTRLMPGGKHPTRVHLFVAGPNGFAFFLGQNQQAIGLTAIYEWDFEGQRGGGYSLAFSLPTVRAMSRQPDDRNLALNGNDSQVEQAMVSSEVS
jgi:hypothetical protein